MYKRQRMLAAENNERREWCLEGKRQHVLQCLVAESNEQRDLRLEEQRCRDVKRCIALDKQKLPVHKRAPWMFNTIP